MSNPGMKFSKPASWPHVSPDNDQTLYRDVKGGDFVPGCGVAIQVDAATRTITYERVAHTFSEVQWLSPWGYEGVRRWPNIIEEEPV